MGGPSRRVRPGRMALLTLRDAAIAVLLAVALGGDPAVEARQQTLEYDVKAAFLYNFTKFVDWPPSAFPVPSDPFRLCVVAEQEFVRRVDEIIQGETARGRPLRRVVPTSDASSCHVLFVGRVAPPHASRLMSAVARLPVLTVGDSPEHLAQGSAIAFAVEDNRVRFDINLAAINRAGLTINPKLLRVARRIVEAP